MHFQFSRFELYSSLASLRGHAGPVQVHRLVEKTDTKKYNHNIMRCGPWWGEALENGAGGDEEGELITWPGWRVSVRKNVPEVIGLCFGCAAWHVGS